MAEPDDRNPVNGDKTVSSLGDKTGQPVARAFSPTAPKKLRRMDLWEFKANLVYTVVGRGCPRPARATK